MRLLTTTSAEGQPALVFDDPKRYEITVDFQTENSDDVLLLPTISQDSRFLTWSSQYAPDVAEFQLCHITFREVVKNTKTQSNGGILFSRLRFTIEGYPVVSAEANETRERMKQSVVLEGPTVAILIVFRATAVEPTNGNPSRPREYVLFIRRPQFGLGSQRFIEIPQGILDETRAFTGEAATVLREQAGLDTIRDYHLVDMTTMSHRRISATRNRMLKTGIVPAPNIFGLGLRLYLYRETIPQSEVTRLRNISMQNIQETGIELCSLHEAWRTTTDSVSLSSLFFFHELRYHMLMPKYRPPREPKKQPVFTSVEELDPNGHGYNLRVVVVEVGAKPIIKVNKNPSANNPRGSITDFIVADGTGCVRFRLNWDQQQEYADYLHVGSKLILRNVNLDMTGGYITLVVHRFSKIDIPSQEEEKSNTFSFEPNLSNDVSALEYEVKVIDSNQLPSMEKFIRLGGRGQRKGRGGGRSSNGKGKAETRFY